MNVKETLKTLEFLNNRIKVASKNAIDLIKELPITEIDDIVHFIEIRKHLNLSKEAIDNAESCTREAEGLIGSALIEMQEAESRVVEALKLLKKSSDE